MNKANSKTRNTGYIVRLWIMLLLASIVFTLAGCGTAIEESPDKDEMEPGDNAWDQVVMKTDDIRNKIPVLIQDITDDTEKKYMSFVAYMDNRVTKPGDTMSEDEVLDQLLRLLPAGFEVSMWYLDKGAQALTSGNGAPMTIDGREGWFSIARYGSIDEMKAATQAVFSRVLCKEQLYPNAFEDSENSKYKEFNLLIYENQNIGGVKDYLSFNSYSAAVISREPGVLTISMSYSHQSDESKEMFPFLFTLIDEGGRWVFDNWPELV